MRTGIEWSEEQVLEDGTPIVLRHIRPTDADQLRDKFLELSPESRYRRFFHTIGRLTDDMVRYLCDVDGTDHVAVVAGFISDDQVHERGMGVARFVRLRDEPSVAEIAITVLDEHQGKGLGGVLLQAITRAAHERGIEHFRGEVLKENAPMRALLATIDAKVVADDGEVIVFDVALVPLLGPNGQSTSAAQLFREAVTAVLRFVERQVGRKIVSDGDPEP